MKFDPGSGRMGFERLPPGGGRVEGLEVGPSSGPPPAPPVEFEPRLAPAGVGSRIPPLKKPPPPPPAPPPEPRPDIPLCEPDRKCRALKLPSFPKTTVAPVIGGRFDPLPPPLGRPGSLGGSS